MQNSSYCNVSEEEATHLLPLAPNLSLADNDASAHKTSRNRWFMRVFAFVVISASAAFMYSSVFSNSTHFEVSAVDESSNASIDDTDTDVENTKQDLELAPTRSHIQLGGLGGWDAYLFSRSTRMITYDANYNQKSVYYQGSWDDMSAVCTNMGPNYRLCRSEEMCDCNFKNSGHGAGLERCSSTPKPIENLRKPFSIFFDNWFAVGDRTNEWMTYGFVGHTWRQCKTHTQIAGSVPSWGSSRAAQPFIRAAKCCFDPLPTATPTFAPTSPEDLVCPPGKYISLVGGCELCPLGTYQADYDAAMECDQCPENFRPVQPRLSGHGHGMVYNGHGGSGHGGSMTYSGHGGHGSYGASSTELQEGAIECEECIEGKYMTAHACLRCDEGKYSDEKGALYCFPCKEGYKVNPTQTGCVLIKTFDFMVIAPEVKTWDEMSKICTDKWMRLCKTTDLTLYCSSHGGCKIDEDYNIFGNNETWVAVDDRRNEWFRMSEYRNFPQTHSYLYGSTPGWGLTKAARNFNNGFECCVDPGAQEKRAAHLQAEKEKAEAAAALAAYNKQAEIDKAGQGDVTTWGVGEPPDFCWKDSYGRGVGKIPKTCLPTHDKIGLLCYPKCPTGYGRFGFDCHQKCPSGFRNDGLYCRLAEYGRGTGFDDVFRDGWGNCRAKYGSCERWGLRIYPTCKAKYSPFGCCICRPQKFSCANDYNMGHQFDISCAKKIIIGAPTTAECVSGVEEKQWGLCYKNCDAGYNGVGPVCWSRTPPTMVGCGMGNAIDSSTCAQILADQIVGPLTIALTVATLGASTAATTAVKVGTETTKKASKLAALTTKIKPLTDAASTVNKNYQIADGAYELGDTTVNNVEKSAAIQAFEASQKALELAAVCDPTGIAGTLAAYTFPKCSLYFGKPAGNFIDNDESLEALDAGWEIGSSLAMKYGKVKKLKKAYE